MEIALIANPAAGRGHTRTFVEEFQQRAKDLDSDINVLWTQRPGHAVELAREAAQHCDVVCVSGGDGTVHEVVNGLMPRPLPLVIVPSGSGNDFAYLFGCPATPEELLATIRDGLGVRIDVVDCGFRYCVNSIGMGFEALVTRRSLAIGRMRGLPLYLTATFRALVSYDCPPMTIRLDDDEPIEGARLLVSVGNGVRAGGGFHLLPDALPDDGMLDICMVEPLGRLQILRLLPLSIDGRHKDKSPVTMRRARRMEISAARPFHMHIDGEYVGEQSEPIHFTVLDRILPVLSMKNRPVRTQQPLEKIL
jgi:YegS/Rv2252/BmrU family lipid kinase